MKILHIVPTYLPAYRYGGPIKSVHELNRELVRKGIDVTVYTTNIDGQNVLNVPVNREVAIDGVKVFYFPITWRFWQYSSDMRHAIRRNIKNFDLIHITSVFLSVSTIGSYYARKFKKPYIISPRGSLMLEPLKKSSLKKKIYLSRIEKRNLGNAAAIHFTTEMEKKEYLDSGLLFKKSIIIPNGFSGALSKGSANGNFLRRKFNIEPHKKIVLFLSRLSWKKGLDTLIPAFKETLEREPDAVLVIAGGDDEDYGKTIQLLITNCKLQIGKNVILTGELAGENKTAAYRESDVFVLPSYAESFGIVVFEAIDNGSPVVITESVGIAKEIKENQAGLVVKKDIQEVSDAMLLLLNDKKLSGKTVLNGKKMIDKYFSWPEIAERFIKEYNKIV